ncbi:MAG: hypothetical protein RSC98_01435, partial [Clostridia bacterium]
SSNQRGFAFPTFFAAFRPKKLTEWELCAIFPVTFATGGESIAESHFPCPLCCFAGVLCWMAA